MKLCVGVLLKGKETESIILEGNKLVNYLFWVCLGETKLQSLQSNSDKIFSRDFEVMVEFLEYFRWEFWLEEEEELKENKFLKKPKSQKLILFRL
jgi:hypothetical protein